MDFFHFFFASRPSVENCLCELTEPVLYEMLFWHTPYPTTLDIRLPNMLETIRSAPPGFVGLYIDSFFHANLRIPFNDFFCEVLEYFHIHISRLSPHGCLKLTNFIAMCKAYDCEPSVDLFRAFFNVCHVGDWVSFRKRGKKPGLFIEPVRLIKGWHRRFFFVESSIVPARFPQLLLPDNLYVNHSFPDDFPAHLEADPSYQRLCRYPIRARAFEEPVQFKAGLAPGWEGYPLPPLLSLDGEEIAFKDYIYNEDNRSLTYAASSVPLVGDVGSPTRHVGMMSAGDTARFDNIATRVKRNKRLTVVV